jgi:hypothetical protein
MRFLHGKGLLQVVGLLLLGMLLALATLHHALYELCSLLLVGWLTIALLRWPVVLIQRARQRRKAAA